MHTAGMRVVVIGAGFAGLAAADALVTAGAEVVVLEARDRVGGRVWSRELPGGDVVEMGAEFILPGDRVIRETAARLGLGLFAKGTTYGDREPRGGMGVSRSELVARLRRGRGGRWVGPARRRVGGGCTRAAADDGRRAGGDPRPGGGLHGLRRGGPGGFRAGRGGLRDRWLRHALDRGRQPARRHRAGSPTRRRRQVAVGGGADRMVVRGRPGVGSRRRDRGRRCSDRRAQPASSTKSRSTRRSRRPRRGRCRRFDMATRPSCSCRSTTTSSRAPRSPCRTGSGRSRSAGPTVGRSGSRGPLPVHRWPCSGWRSRPGRTAGSTPSGGCARTCRSGRMKPS